MMCNLYRISKFQSTLPVRGATASSSDADNSTKFQSTLPVRGATDMAADLHDMHKISIHAPRAGSDLRTG